MAIKDRRGERFGLLTCIAPTDQRGKDGCTLWRCRCDCGNECLVSSAQLARGDRKSCGCLQKQPRPIQAGQRFGALTVLEDAGEQGKRHFWRCRCDCGNECVVSASNLNRGKNKSCGCLAPKGPRDLLGQRFGSLVVTAYEGREGRDHMWRCQCDCGGETVVCQKNLLTGHTKSCGCLQRQSPLNNMRWVDGTSVVMLERRKLSPIKSNRSGYNGVYWNKTSGMWRAQITFKGKTYFLGSFKNIQDAVAARKKGEELFDDFLDQYYAREKMAAAVNELAAI